MFLHDVFQGGHTGGRSDPGTVHKRERRPSVRVGPNGRKGGGGVLAKWATCACPLPDREGVRVGQAHCLLGSGESSPPLPSKRCVALSRPTPAYLRAASRPGSGMRGRIRLAYSEKGKQQHNENSDVFFAILAEKKNRSWLKYGGRFLQTLSRVSSGKAMAPLCCNISHSKPREFVFTASAVKTNLIVLLLF